MITYDHHLSISKLNLFYAVFNIGQLSPSVLLHVSLILLKHVKKSRATRKRQIIWFSNVVVSLIKAVKTISVVFWIKVW